MCNHEKRGAITKGDVYCVIMKRDVYSRKKKCNHEKRCVVTKKDVLSRKEMCNHKKRCVMSQILIF